MTRLGPDSKTSPDTKPLPDNKVALITGAARRIGAALARATHGQGYNLVVHYQQSETAAQDLTAELNAARSGSVICLGADLSQLEQVQGLASRAQAEWGRLDLLVNNASRFYSTPLANAAPEQWQDLIDTNLRAPFFLSLALREALQKTRGCIVNIIDIYAERPLPQHSIYSISKAGLAMLTKSLARELGPNIRVNGIAPGAILWPAEAGAAEDAPEQEQAALLERTVMGKLGAVEDVSKALLFFADQAPYVTGQILAIDGGRSLNQ